jgi:hypothetical protein
VDPTLDAFLWDDAQAAVEQDARARDAQGRIARIRTGANPVQLAFIDDMSEYESLRCPRRSGKSFAMALKAVLIGELKPNSRILVISLTLKSTRENYWDASPSGIFAMNRLFNLGLRFNHTDSVWWHQNGSRGRLAGAETRADIEYLRGAAAEADVVIIDECKSFAPQLLQELMTDVIEPGLMTRNGMVIMGGTPGLLPYGPFYAATATEARKTVKLDPSHKPECKCDQCTLVLPTCVPWESRTEKFYTDAAEKYKTLGELLADADEEEAADEPWSLHSWTVKDNIAWPKQWQRALRAKRRNAWDDDHPTWRREYLGEWVVDGEGLVYAYAARKAKKGDVNWFPERSRENRTGLPPEDGPWHLVMGLDIGFEDDTAIVVAGYSERVAEFRVIYDFKAPHMLVDQLEEKLEEVVGIFGMPECIVADTGGGGSKMIVETYAQRYGLPMVKAEKTEKFDHIELVNSDFHSGRIKIIAGSDLERELLGLQWDLEKGDRKTLAHLGKLREDPKCPNHLCDALLYSWRFSYHFWAHPGDGPGPQPGTDAWYLEKEREAERREVYSERYATDGYPGLGSRRTPPMTRDDVRWHQAQTTLTRTS